MTDKPKLQIIDGGFDEILARKIFKLLMTPWDDNQDEIKRLTAILERRGDLTVVQGGQDSTPNTGNDKQEEKE